MLEDAAIFQALCGSSFFFSFSGVSRGISQHWGNVRILRAAFWKKNYMETFSCFPKQKMLRGLLLRENSCTSFAKAGISEFP